MNEKPKPKPSKEPPDDGKIKDYEVPEKIRDTLAKRPWMDPAPKDKP